jgi:hypoxanthine phosphoribosyltransferase
MKKEIHLFDKSFVPYLDEQLIANRIKELAAELKEHYKNKNILFLSVLNGSFMFTSDLMKCIDISVEVSFVKLSSYEGTSSSGHVHELIGLNEDIKGKHIVILEDIVDTGLTVERVMKMIQTKDPESMEVCTLLYKEAAFEGEIPPKYFGFKIPNKFVVGYGLDYNELGRNLREIYQLKE